MYETCFDPSTTHFFFTIIGASPAAFSKTSTAEIPTTTCTIIYDDHDITEKSKMQFKRLN